VAVTLIGLAIVVVASIFVTWPLLERSQVEEANEQSETSALHKEKNAALEAIREIDFDHRVGKISDEDHAALRADLETRALEALTALDEAAEPALRAVAGHATAQSGDDPAGFCSHCGTRFKRETRFCVGCGEKLPRSRNAGGRRRAHS